MGVAVGWDRERVTVDAAGVGLDLPLANCSEVRLGHVTTSDNEVRARLGFRWAAPDGEPSGEIVLHFPASLWDDLVVLADSITAGAAAPRENAPWAGSFPPLNGGVPASPRSEKPSLPRLDFSHIPVTPDWVGFRSLGHGGFPGSPD
ncbi:hypothetical protein [Amycolatopsis alba]|nr:hypothetical protein [Amycolatopsis alba]